MPKRKKVVLGLYKVIVTAKEGRWQHYNVIVIAPNTETAEWLALSRVANIHLVTPSSIEVVTAPELITQDFRTVGAIHSEYSGE